MRGGGLPGDAFWRQALELSPRGAPALRVGRGGTADRAGTRTWGEGEEPRALAARARAAPRASAGFSRARWAQAGPEFWRGPGRAGARRGLGRAPAGRRWAGGGAWVSVRDRGAGAALPTSDAKRRRSACEAPRQWRRQDYGARVLNYSANSACVRPAASEGFCGADRTAGG